MDDKLDLQYQKELDEYFAYRNLMQNDFAEYVSLKKDVVKQNFLNKIIVDTEELDFNTILGYMIKV